MNPCFNHVMGSNVQAMLLLSCRCKMLMYSSTLGNLPVPSGLVGHMGLCIQRERRVWAQFHLAVPRIRRESWQMAEGMLGLSTARTQPPFPSQGDGKNRRLRQRVRASGCWVSVIKGTTVLSHVKYFF